MSQGILERIETKLDLLIAKLGVQVEGVLLETTVSLSQAGSQVASAFTHNPFVELSEDLTEPLSKEDASALSKASGLKPAHKTTLDSSDPYAGVDKDGVRWDKRIHSKAAEPKSQTTGKWKKRKGLKEGLYEEVMAELLAKAEEQTDEVAQESSNVNGPFFWVDSITGVFNTADSRADMDKLLLIPSTKEISREEFDVLVNAETPMPKVPTVPGVPKVPTVPGVPKAPIEMAAKPAVLTLIKAMEDTYDVEPNDINQLMVEVTGVDSIAKLDEVQLNELKGELEAWKTSLDESSAMITEIALIAGKSGNGEAASAGVLSILEPHDAEQIGHLHYSAVNGVKDVLAEYLTAWKGA